METTDLDTIYTTLEQVELHYSEDKKYILQSGNRQYYIGDTLFTIISSLQQKNNMQQVCDRLYNEKGISLQPVQLEQIVQDNFARLSLGDDTHNHTTIPQRKRSSYIYLKFPIIGRQLLSHITRPLVYLFHPYVFGVLALAGIAASVYLLQQINFGSLFSIQNMIAKSNLALFYPALILTMLFHELGHAAACRKFNILPDSIGFGFYLIFPVFYTDVSKIWRLKKMRRILVNSGGVYFQLLINLCLLGYYLLIAQYQLPGKNLIEIIAVVNTFIALYSLNPFLRNDGYWIFSDYFNIPNLMKNAFYYPVYLYKRLSGKTTPGTEAHTMGGNTPLGIYSVLNYAVFILLTGYCWYYLSNHLLPGIGKLFSDNNFPANLLITSNTLFVLKVLFTLFIYIYTLYKAGKFIYSYLNRRLWKA
jgi:putative peptide zinc metalloprotease protein